MHDALLERIQRNAIACCVGMAVVAAAATRGNVRAALSVLGGGALIMVSFISIRGGIETLAAFAAGPKDHAHPPKIAPALAKLVGRYALLALLAYVMIARLRLHPLGLIAGASSVAIAAAFEAGRVFVRK